MSMRFRPVRFSIIAACQKSSGGVSTTTFDPSNTQASLTLSNGNLTATSGVGAYSYRFTRSVASHSTGKYYAEITVNTGTGNAGSTAAGIANSTVPSLGRYLGEDNNSIGCFDNGGMNLNSSVVIATPSFATSNVLGLALDAGGQLFWFRVGGGNWNNSGTANPATGAGGQTIAALGSGPFFLALSICGTSPSPQWTANFGGTAYANSAPAGFGNW